jgi:hypothetical protein
MSDTTALSHQYATHSQFVEQLNRWIGTVKRRRAAPAGSVGAAESTPGEARTRLAAVIEAVLARLSAEPAGGHAAVGIPEEVIQRIDEDHRGDREWYLQDLECALEALRGDNTPDERAWKIIDEIGDAADAVATASFRRLWRR